MANRRSRRHGNGLSARALRRILRIGVRTGINAAKKIGIVKKLSKSGDSEKRGGFILTAAAAISAAITAAEAAALGAAGAAGKIAVEETIKAINASQKHYPAAIR